MRIPELATVAEDANRRLARTINIALDLARADRAHHRGGERPRARADRGEHARPELMADPPRHPPGIMLEPLAEPLRELALPEDERNLIVTVHHYWPTPFTMQGENWLGQTELGHPSAWLGTTWDGTPSNARSSTRDSTRSPRTPALTSVPRVRR